MRFVASLISDGAAIQGVTGLSRSTRRSSTGDMAKGSATATATLPSNSSTHKGMTLCVLTKEMGRSL